MLGGILDGIVYAGIIAIGFAFTENILYLAQRLRRGPGLGPRASPPRRPGRSSSAWYLRPFAHPLFTVLSGIGFGIAALGRRPAVRVLAPLAGYVGALTAHALWNGSVFFGGGHAFIGTYLLVMVPAFLFLVGFAVWTRRREGEMLARSLTDCANRGFLTHAEVPWLVRIPARRYCRKDARARGGRLAQRAMREYQQQAIELGFLHSRFLRGTAPDDVVQRGQAMVDHLAALRPQIRFPDAAAVPAARTAAR